MSRAKDGSFPGMSVEALLEGFNVENPRLGKYFQTIVSGNVRWRESVEKSLTPEESAIFNRRADNLYIPRAILFADASSTSHRYFDLLDDNKFTFRVLPLDHEISTPAIGIVAEGKLLQTDLEVEHGIPYSRSVHEAMLRMITSPDWQAMFPEPDPIAYESMVQKMHQVDFELAVLDFYRITHPPFN